MAEARSDRSERGPGTPGRAGVDPLRETQVDPAAEHQAVEPRDVRHDDAASNRARVSAEPARRPSSEKNTDEIQRDIAHTRAEMSDTLDALEEKLSPAHLKHEVMDTVHETIDEVQDRFHPRRLARNAGRSMLDTIRDNPLPALVAGLSVGWLLFQSGSDDDYYDYDYYDEGDYRAGYGRRATYRRPAYGRPTYRRPAYRSYPGAYYEGAYSDDGYYGRDVEGSYEDDTSMRDRAEHAADDVKERASSAADQAKERAGHVADHAQERASRMAGRAQEHVQDLGHQVQDFGHQVQYGARRATSGLEHFIYSNPLAAGAVAVGVGALIGSLLPSTHYENEMMGAQRDRLVERARHEAEDTLERAEHAVDRAADAAKGVASEATGKMERAERAVDRTADAAKDKAHEIKEKAEDKVEGKA